MFCTLNTNYTKQQMSQPKCLDWWTKKKLIGGYHKEIGPFFPLCECELRLVSSSKCVTEQCSYTTVDIRKIGPKVTLQQPPRHTSATHTTHTRRRLCFFFFSQSQTDDFCAVRVKNSLHLQLKCRPANTAATYYLS